MKKALAFLSAVLLIVGILTPAAFAANETSGSTLITYNVESGYTISIPATVLLNNQNYLTFSAANVSLEYGKHLYIELDRSRTEFMSDGDNLIMRGGSGNDTIECGITVGNLDDDQRHSLYDTTYIVASFASGDESPSQYGKLYLTPYANGGTPSGTYSCTLYYNIGVR